MEFLGQALKGYDSVVICGPTASGKTGLYEEISQTIKVECINADTGQMYRELSIGTAKPKLDTSLHCFDILSLGQRNTVVEFQQMYRETKKEIAGRQSMPIIVGGSFFYVQSLFYPIIGKPSDFGSFNDVVGDLTTEELYKKLKVIDPVRAREIEPNDRYRLTRAIKIWQTSGEKPSEFKPKFQDNGEKTLIVYIDPGQELLDQRIKLRLKIMLKEGWMDEVCRLSAEQKHILKDINGLIGYREILEVVRGELDLQACEDKIFFATRNYAKRQRKFFGAMEKKISKDNSAKNLKIVRLDRCDVGALTRGLLSL